MITPCMAVGKVGRIFAPEPTEDKKPFVRLVLTWEEFLGAHADGSPRHTTRFVTCVAFGQHAEGMKALRTGDTIAAQGRVQASRPYQSNNGEYVAYLELYVEKWQLVARGPAEKQARAAFPESTSAPVADPSPEEIDDPFASEEVAPPTR